VIPLKNGVLASMLAKCTSLRVCLLGLMLSSGMCMGCTSSSSQPTPAPSDSILPTLQNNDSSLESAVQPQESDMKFGNNGTDNWSDDIARTHFPKKDSRYQQVLDAVNAMNADFFNAKMLSDYRYGNLVLVRVAYQIPAPDATPIPDKIVAVILGAKTLRLLELPNKELFAHFARVVQDNLTMLQRDDRIEVAASLATGYRYRILDNVKEGRENDNHKYVPTWQESGGEITIQYHREILGNTFGRVPNRKQSCTITVDANQNFMQECSEPVPLDL